MKFGFRKPNIKSSIRARTTGRVKRAVKRAIIPNYGKKGMGWIKNPKKAAYNKIYHQVTFGVPDILKAGSTLGNSSTKSAYKHSNAQNQMYVHITNKRKAVYSPSGKHPTTRSERICGTAAILIIYTIVVWLIFVICPSILNWVLAVICAIVAVYFLVYLWECKETTEYKRIYIDNQDHSLITDINPCINETTHKEVEQIRTECGSLSYHDIMQRELNILNDCARLMNSTVNPDTFFSRYRLYMEKLSILAAAETGGKIDLEPGSESPSEKLKEMQNNVAENFNEFINKYWNSVNQKAKTMKTPKGKENQYRKFYGNLMKYKEILPQECIENINNKITKAGINILSEK